MKVIGHRGARGLAPENTVAAMRKGLLHHVDELQLDVRVTKDSKVIVHHDTYLTDPDGARHTVSTSKLRALQQHKPDLVTLEVLLKAVGNSVPIQIEVQPGEPTAPIIAIVKNFLHRGWKPGDFLLSSQEQKTLLELHDALPNIETVVIEQWSSVRAVYRARQLGTKRVSLAQRWLWWGVVQNFARHGYKLAAYPVNSERQGRRWDRHGLYAVITDYPDIFEVK